eukprot:TRINITY_DN5425_c0_g1_i5.p1 TRINITY_DN5425_c0_g1~~TRINITY_DN5425_c0_g1_i5.p1  ORF type:complete len:101 (+),score=5.31 TRINITY_DN5425_c0_g1_i5:120-422(+)
MCIRDSFNMDQLRTKTKRSVSFISTSTISTTSHCVAQHSALKHTRHCLSLPEAASCHQCGSNHRPNNPSADSGLILTSSPSGLMHWSLHQRTGVSAAPAG